METLFLKLVNMSITASWLVLAIIAVRLIFKKAPKWILCLLWGLVAIRLICPFSIESSLSLIPDSEPLSQEIIYAPETARQAHGDILDSEGNVLVSRVPAARGEILDAQGNVILEKPLTVPDAKPALRWTSVLSKIWMVGVIVMLSYSIVSYQLLKRKVATAIPLKRGIKQSEYVDSPFVLGILRPVIYLPFDMAEADCAYVIAHEKAHIRRRDHWWKPLGFLLLSIHWFNPLLWVAYILLCRDIEAACDEKVIRDMDKNNRRAYSAALLNCSVHRRRIAACPLAFGETGVKTRVKGVMNYKKPAFWVILIALVVSIIMAVCFLTNPINALPITMRVDYVSRTRAELKFTYDDSLADEDFQISEYYVLEILEQGSWHEIGNLAEDQASAPINEIQSEDAEFDSWSLLNWEENYGRLPDGNFRIRKDITINNDSDAAKTHPVYVEFTIGGTAEDYITYSLEDITPTGANLYEHEKVDDSVVLIYSEEGFWLEVLQDGQWVYMKPTEETHFGKEKEYIHALHYPSSHIELDWSSLYGALPGGTYRIAREITHTGEADLRLCTVYGEFTIQSDSDNQMRSEVISVPGITLSLNNVINLSRQGRDLTLDDFRFYAYEEQGNTRTYPINETWHLLIQHDGESEKPISMRLIHIDSGNHIDITQGNGEDAITAFITGQNPEAAERIVCMDIVTRKHTCLSSQKHMAELRLLLYDLENHVQPASKDFFAQNIADEFNTTYIDINYEVGKKTICISRDFSMIWVSGSEEGYLISDSEPIRQYIYSIMDGVREKETFGEPFASMDAPWDWCANIDTSAVKSAQLHVCLSTYSNGNSRGSSSTNGVISYQTLEELIGVLNQIPNGNITPGSMLSKKNYHSFFVDQQTQNTAISIVDGVNHLGVVLKYKDGTVTMLLTDEMEKVTDEDPSYLEPTQLWTVQDEKLTAFMQSLSDNPPVIMYSVGAEYEWQDPIQFSSGNFSLVLRLIEGWEFEYVSNPTDSGIRCRPKGITDGYIYFSYWPDEYTPKEENRFINDGMYHGWTYYTSYPDSIANENGFDTRHAIWSYKRYDLESGDYAVINEGADAWFLEYEDQISDIISLSDIATD